MELAEVHELVMTVAGVDAACRDRSALVAAVAASARLPAWLDGRDVALAAQMEQVASYPEKALADASRTSLREAERTVRRAHTVQSLPPLGEALAVGAVGGAHVDIAARALRQLEPHERGALVDRTGWLVGVAERTTPEEFGQALDAEVRWIRRGRGAERLEQQVRATRAADVGEPPRRHVVPDGPVRPGHRPTAPRSPPGRAGRGRGRRAPGALPL